MRVSTESWPWRRNSPASPAGIWTHDLFITNPVLYHWAISAPRLTHNALKTGFYCSVNMTITCPVSMLISNSLVYTYFITLFHPHPPPKTITHVTNFFTCNVSMHKCCHVEIKTHKRLLRTLTLIRQYETSANVQRKHFCQATSRQIIQEQTMLKMKLELLNLQ